MSVRLGISPIGWSNDDMPELGGATPLETCLAEARLAGFEGIELGHKFPRDPAVLRPILERHGLSLISGWYSGRLLERSVAEEIAVIENHRALLAAMGCAVLVYAETTGSIAADRTRRLSSRPRLGAADWRDLGRRLSEFAEQLSRRGIRLAYHHHMGTVVENEAEIDRLMASTGNSVILLLDTGHLVFAGADPARLARRYGLARIRAADASFLDGVLDGVFTVPSDGCINFGELLAALAAVHYSGWLVVEAEQDPTKAPALAYAQLGYAHLSAAAARAGLMMSTARGSGR